MANRVPPPPREFNWRRMLRTLSFWALLIVETGNIASVEITEQRDVKGTFKRPVTVKRQTVERFNMRLPFEANETWVASLQAKGVEVRARETGQSVGAVLIVFLPYLLIFGLVIFMLRQMQQGGNRAFAFGKSKAKLL